MKVYFHETVATMLNTPTSSPTIAFSSEHSFTFIVRRHEVPTKQSLPTLYAMQELEIAAVALTPSLAMTGRGLKRVLFAPAKTPQYRSVR